MLFSNKKDGIYPIKLSDSNPFNEYLLIKTYGDVKKDRFLPSIKECRQQEEEWDDYYRTIYPDYVDYVCPIYPNETKREHYNKYAIYNLEGVLVDEGVGSYIASKYGTTSKNLANASRASGIFISKHQNKKFKISKLNNREKMYY